MNLQDIKNMGRFKSLDLVIDNRPGKVVLRIWLIFFALLIVFLLLPWTQNIRGKGYITTLRPEQRPQSIPSVIGGRIEAWYVREGQQVAKGDTLLFISEIKDTYFDPLLMDRTAQQLGSKEMAGDGYFRKMEALEAQIQALKNTRSLKILQASDALRQQQLKVVSDSIDWEASKVQLSIADARLLRMQKLYQDGLNPLTDLEMRQNQYQDARAAMIAAQNRLDASRYALRIADMELQSLEQQYADKVAKAEAEYATAASDRANVQVDLAKLQSQLSNVTVRSGFYYITAPQDGFVTKTIRAGIGEIVKEGDELLTIMPTHIDIAVEVYVKPVDLPLIQVNQSVNFIFDGWPAFIFSGWPGMSFGTFKGTIVGIDQYISTNGKYRILVAPAPGSKPWPEALRVGSGASAIMFLQNVRVWYEIWRQINGFPPEFYSINASTK